MRRVVFLHATLPRIARLSDATRILREDTPRRFKPGLLADCREGERVWMQPDAEPVLVPLVVKGS